MTVELYLFGIHLGTTGKSDSFILWFRWLGAIFIPIWEWKPFDIFWLDWHKKVD